MKRRALLSAALATTVPLSGCHGRARAIRLEARNFTDEAVSVDLRVFSTDNSQLYEYSGTFAAHQSYELTELDGSIDYLELSVDGGESTRHEYTPTFDESCERKLLYLRVQPIHPEFDYLCQPVPIG